MSWLTPQPLHWPQTRALLPPLQGPGSCLLCEPRNPHNNLPISEGTITNEYDPREKLDPLSSDITSGEEKNQKTKAQEKAPNCMSVSHPVWGKSELQTHPKWNQPAWQPHPDGQPQPAGTGGRQKCSQLGTQPRFWRGEASLRKRLLLGRKSPFLRLPTSVRGKRVDTTLICCGNVRECWKTQH